MKKIIFCTYSSVYSSIVLEQLLSDKDIKVVGVINSTRVLHSKYSQFRGSLEQLKISGFSYSLYLFFITDLFRWIQGFSFLFAQATPKTIHKLADENKLPIIDVKNINSVDGVDFIKKNDADFLLAAHFNQRVKTQILSLPTLQCINIHPSLLPAYQGVDPVFFAMKNNERMLGVTVHCMEETFDSGELLRQSEGALKSENSLFANNCQLFEKGAKLAIEWVKNPSIKVMNNRLSSESYDSWPAATDVKTYKQKGKTLIKLSELFKKCA